MAALLAGTGVTEVSRRYNLPKSTVASIQAHLQPEIAQVRTETRSSLDELLLDALAANLAAQKRIVEVASEPEYLKKQSAADIADLYETFADKSIRLLEAASLGADERTEDP